MWRRTCRLVGRHRELALVLIFFAAAGWALVEVLTSEGPRRVAGALPILLHSVQGIITSHLTGRGQPAWLSGVRGGHTAAVNWQGNPASAPG